MNTNQIQKRKNLVKVPNQKAKIDNELLLAKQNLENLLGQTVKNTVVLDEQNQNNTQHINPNQNQNNKKPQMRKSNSLEKQNKKIEIKENKNLKMRNSDANRMIMNKNGTNNLAQNVNRLPSKGLYGEMKKKLNSILKNGKLICNIDINEESQGVENTNNNKNKNKNNNLIRFTNDNKNAGTTLQKKNSRMPAGLNNNQTQVAKPTNDINQNAQNIKPHPNPHPHQNNMQTKNIIESINNQNENIKTVKSVYINQNDKIGNSYVNPLISQNSIQSKALNSQLVNNTQNILDTRQIIPGETVKSIYEAGGSNQTSNLLSQLCMGQTVKSVYSGETKENPYPGIMPNETITSVYPIKESGNSINKNGTQNLLSQMAPGATVKSIYPQHESQAKGLLSQMLPTQTIKSVYNQETHPLFSQMIPGSTAKSVYTTKK